MDIVFVLNGKMRLAPDTGGDRHTLGLARYCLDQGDRVRILAPSGTRDLNKDTLADAEWILTENKPLPGSISKADIPSVFFKYLQRTMAGSKVESDPCDLIYCGSILPHEILCAAAWKKRGQAKALACRSDQIFHNEPFRKGFKYTAHRIASKTGMRTALKHGNQVIAVNELISSQWKQARGSRRTVPDIGILPYGARQEWISSRKEKRDFDIVYFARLDHVKGADLIPAILKSLKDKNLSPRMNIVGEGMLKDSIVDKLNKMKLSHLVTWQGGISGDERFDHLGNAKIMLYPTREDGFPMAVVEGLALGLVVVATDNAQLRSAFGDSLAYGTGTSPESLADKIEDILKSDSVANEFITKGTDFVKELPPLGNFENYRSLLLKAVADA
ncbi:hypothetical protein BVX97_01330 [bacterium E08(2017)]|nr:hypothetical protein BVX97_01330 [bacterium E08(2017)]